MTHFELSVFLFLNQNKLLTSFCKIGLVKMEKLIIPSRRKLPVSRRGQIIQLIIQAKSEKKSLSRLAASLGLNTQTLHSIWRRKDRILKALESNPNFKADIISPKRDVLLDQMEEQLATWVFSQPNFGTDLGEKVICQTAQKLTESLCYQNNRAPIKFGASSGWFRGFKKRHNIVTKRAEVRNTKFRHVKKVYAQTVKSKKVKSDQSNVPNKIKTLSLSRKGQLIQLISHFKREGRSINDLAKELNMKVQTLHTIWRRKDQIFSALESNPNFEGDKISPKTDILIIGIMEEQLANWVFGQLDSGVLVDDQIICETARELTQKICQQYDRSSIPFEGSDGWLKGFKKRYNITPEKLSGEADKVKSKVMSVSRRGQLIEMMREAKKEGKSISKLATDLNIPIQTLHAIWRRKNTVLEALQSNPKSEALIISQKRNLMVDIMETKLAKWISSQHAIGADLDVQIICKQAKQFIANICNQIGQTPVDFKASNGWYRGFRKRHNIIDLKKKESEEAPSAFEEEIDQFKIEFEKLVTLEDYHPESVFNLTEFGLYWKKKEAGFPEQNKEGDRQRVTLLLGANASGTFRLKPMLINKHESPRCLKRIEKEALPVLYCWNSNLSLTEEDFIWYFYSYFCPQVLSHLKDKGLPERVLLLLNSASSFPKKLNHPNVKILFMPANNPSTTLLQPMEQGPISTFKTYFMKNAIRDCFLHGGQFGEVQTFEGEEKYNWWKDFGIDSAIKVVDTSWSSISNDTLHNAWKNVWPDLFHDQQSTTYKEEDKVIFLEDETREFGFIREVVPLKVDYSKLSPQEVSQLKAEAQRIIYERTIYHDHYHYTRVDCFLGVDNHFLTDSSFG